MVMEKCNRIMLLLVVIRLVKLLLVMVLMLGRKLLLSVVNRRISERKRKLLKIFIRTRCWGSINEVFDVVARWFVVGCASERRGVVGVGVFGSADRS